MIAIDFETWCELSLPKVGLYNYINHPSLTVLMVSVVQTPLNPANAPNEYVLDLLPDHPDAQRNLQHLHALMKLAKTNAEAVVAANSEFEQSVLAKLFPDDEMPELVDISVINRLDGASSSLDAASHQLLDNTAKQIGYKQLLKKFAMADECPTWKAVETDKDWEFFRAYCLHDSVLCIEHMNNTTQPTDTEWYNQRITALMNRTGWFVDMPAVERMRELAQRNRARALEQFYEQYDPSCALNFNSTPQLRAWCKARGVVAASFSEDAVAALLARVDKRISTHGSTQALEAVAAMLRTKQILGGSSLSKLDTLQQLVCEDGRLRNSYIHCGAGQTARTSGTGVQMQNLKRLGDIRNMAELFDEDCTWSNSTLADNMRQLFKAEDPNGKLIVGDFSSVESRGLAYLAGEAWKLSAYQAGEDIYIKTAATHFGIPYDEVTSDQRRFGKVGELSCGYGAGPDAVQRFAHGMSMDLAPTEAGQIVQSWRAANSKIVDFWAQLDQMLHTALAAPSSTTEYTVDHSGHLTTIKITAVQTSPSLAKLHPGALDLWVVVRNSALPNGGFRRVFKGAYFKGRNITYHKAAKAATSNGWSDSFRDPVTKQMKNYTIYGGKLAGILTQSFCRELFFGSLRELVERNKNPNLKLIGQFHDEIVLEWSPRTNDTPGISLDGAMHLLQSVMSTPLYLPKDFPLAAEIKHAYRYIK